MARYIPRDAAARMLRESARLMCAFPKEAAEGFAEEYCRLLDDAEARLRADPDDQLAYWQAQALYGMAQREYARQTTRLN